MIVPVIKRSEPRLADDAVVLPPEFRPVSDSLVGELMILYAFDLPGHFAYLSEHDCQSLGLALHDLRKLAVRNLTRLRSKPEILRPRGPAVMLRLDGDLEASLLLVDSLWPHLARSLGGEVVVGGRAGTSWLSAALKSAGACRPFGGRSTARGNARRIES